MCVRGGECARGVWNVRAGCGMCARVVGLGARVVGMCPRVGGMCARVG